MYYSSQLYLVLCFHFFVNCQVSIVVLLLRLSILVLFFLFFFGINLSQVYKWRRPRRQQQRCVFWSRFSISICSCVFCGVVYVVNRIPVNVCVLWLLCQHLASFLRISCQDAGRLDRILYGDFFYYFFCCWSSFVFYNFARIKVNLLLLLLLLPWYV